LGLKGLVVVVVVLVVVVVYVKSYETTSEEPQGKVSHKYSHYT
jgi:hypothetical protein